MLKGDLVTTPLPAVLRQLADGVVSGCLHVEDGVGSQAKVYLRGGHVYAVQVPGRRPQLGARLVSSGALGPEALAEALEAQRTELQGWRLGELLVHLGYVDQPVVEAFIDEQLREQTTDLMRWPTGTWKFRVNERTREDVAPPTPVETLLAAVEERRQQWDVINEVLHGPDAVPMLSAAGQTDDEMAIDPDAWSLLCKVDGVRSVSDLAKECGFTLFEAGQVVYSLVRTGLLEVEETLAPEAPAEPFAPLDVTAKLAAAFAPSEPEVVIPSQPESLDHELSPADVANLVANALREDRSLEPAPPPADDIDASVDRVSQALSQMLGEDTTATDDLFAAPKVRARGSARAPKPKTPSEIERERKQNARAEASKKRRAADAEELALAQAELEAARAAEAAADAAKLAADHQAEVVSLAEARQAAEERAAAEAAEAERVAAERAAAEAERQAAEERARIEAELREAAEREAAEEAARLEAERQAAEAEAARIAAEAEAERVAAEQAEAERQAAEIAAAEARARVEAELREAAEREAAEEAARLEAERQAAEAEAARIAAEAEAERVAAEQAEAERQAAEIAAAEERARVEAELREAAEREAAEEAARLEAERLAAEQAEAERQAAEIAASAERARAEEELRLAAEAEVAEAARVEAERVAAEAEVARLAAEAAEAERLAEEEAEQSRSAEQRLHAADAFAELSATAATAGDTLVAEAPVETALEDDDLDDDVDDTPLPSYPPADTDMASLFRELSSLGLEDEPSSSIPAPPAPRPKPSGAAAAAASKQKKKGLFGR